MKHKCFISFKTEDQQYKDALQNQYDLDIIDKSLNNPINSDNEDYIMQVLRRDYLQDSTVTLVLIGTHSAENNFFENQNYIKRELQASLYDKPNGILGIVLPEMYDKVYTGSHICSTCGNSHNYVKINNDTTIREFNYNYYLPTDKCAWAEEDRYCVLVKWDDFISHSSYYIQKAFDKREDPIRKKIKKYPK
ncbi:TIR domain-containing protein [Latilactobacillus sakei]